jgi:hypothetical protein
MKSGGSNSTPVRIQVAASGSATTLDKRVVPPRLVRDMKYGRTLHLPSATKT